MTNATELFRAGRLQAAIDAQIQDVKSHPGDHGRRLFLFDLLAYAGDFDRARKQIAVVNYGDPERDMIVSSYSTLMDAEDHRTKVFRDCVMPQFLTQPPEWIFPRMEAVVAMKAGDPTKAQELLAKSDADAGSTTLTVNGKSIDGFRDCDDLFGPVLEVFAKGQYFWLPVSHLESLTALPPKTPRDLIWFPIKLSVKNGPAGDAFLPTRYPNSATAENDQLKLARATDWSAPEAGPIRGLGMRMFLADDDAIPVPDLREVMG